MNLDAVIARAAPPPERDGDGPFEPVPMDEDAWARRRARLAGAFGSPDRLAAHAEACGFAVDAWIDRFRDVRLAGPRPDWAHAFGAVLERLSDGPAPYPEVRRWAAATAAADWPACLPRGPECLEGPLDHLAGRLGAALEPTLLVERQLGSQPGWLARFQRSPALAFVVGRVVADWAGDLATMAARAAADRAGLAHAFFGGSDPGALTAMECGLGDPHAGGRSVAVLRFEQGSVVYKPKDLRVADAVAAVAALVPEGNLAPPRRWSRDGYAWEAYCEPRPIAGPEEADAFFSALGGWLALLQPLGGTDFWFDNLIAEGAVPRFVDFETAVQPPLPAAGAQPLLSADGLAALEASPLVAGILPMPFPVRDGEEPTDIGCLARPGRHRMPLSVPGRNEPAEWHDDRFAPRLADGTTADAAAHFAAFEDGYFRTARALAEPARMRQAVDILERAGEATVRVIRLDTWSGYRAMSASLAPRHLADGVWREIALHAALAGWPDLSGVLREAAVRDLRRLDIPLFHTRLASRDLLGSEGDRRPAFFERDAVAATRARFRTLAGQALDERAAWLHSGFGLRADNPPRRTPARAAPAPAAAGDLMAWSDEMASDIVRRSVADGAGRPTWIGRNHDVFTGVQGVGPLGFDVLSGRAGVALALRELADRLNRRELRDLADETLGGAARDYLDHVEAGLMLGAGYVVGVGGLIAAMAQEAGLRPLATEVFDAAAAGEVWMRSGKDYVSGLAGWREAATALGASAPARHGTARAYAPSAGRRLAQWLAPERAAPLCADRCAAARLRLDHDRHGSWFASLWLDDRHHLSGIDGLPALAVAFARLAENGPGAGCRRVVAGSPAAVTHRDNGPAGAPPTHPRGFPASSGRRIGT